MSDSSLERHAQGDALLQDIDRVNRMMTLRSRGMSYRRIAQVLEREDGIKMSFQNVARVIKHHLAVQARESQESAEELRALENDRLDELLMVAGPAARDGDLKAMDRVLRISERRARLNGLDAPTVHQHTHTGSILHELGVDPDELARQEEAFQRTFLEEPVTDAEVVE